MTARTTNGKCDGSVVPGRFASHLSSPHRKSAKDGAPVLLWLFEKGERTAADPCGMTTKKATPTTTAAATAAATTKATEGNEAVSRGPGPGGASSFCGCGGRTFSGLRGCVRSRRGPGGCARRGFC